MIIKCKIILLCVFSFFISTICLGRITALDSLIELYPTIENEREKIDMINSIGFKYYTVDIEKSLEFAKIGLERSERINYQEGKGEALNVMSIYYEANGDMEKSIALNKDVLEIGEAIHDNFLIVASCINLGNKYDTQGNPQRAISYYQRAINISEKTNDIGNLCLGFANLAILHDKLNENEVAYNYFQKAKKILDQNPEMPMFCWFYGVLGFWHFENNNFDEAKRCYNVGLEESIRRNDNRAIVSLNISLSKLNSILKLNELAEQNIKTAIKSAKLVGDRLLTLQAEIGLLEHYLETNQAKKAKSLGRSALLVASVYNFSLEEVKIYDLLSRLHVKNDEYKLGYELNQDYLRLKDSLFSENKRIEVAKIEKKYQSTIKEKENVLLRAQQSEQKALLENQRMLGITMMAIILLISIIGLVIYLAYKSQKNGRMQLEGKVMERTKELKQSNKKLKKSNEELESFAYIASHDLKEPLRNIGGFTKLLQRKLPADISPTTREYVSFILRNTQQMHTLIEDVLEYSRVTQKVPDEPVMLDFNIVLEEIKKSLANTVDEINAVIIIEKDLPKKLTDSSKIHFLFKNLIENGLKYNESEIPEIRIGCNKVKNQLIYYVSDNGIGIDEIYKDKIFEMFKRLHNRGEYDGTGLGLSICKKIVEELGGKIWMDSKNSTGTTFYFTLEPNQPEENREPVRTAKFSLANMN